MVLIKREDVTKQGFCKIPSSGKSVISTYLMFFGLEGPERGWGGGGGGGGGGSLFEFEFEGGGVGMGAYSRLGAY